MITKCCLFIYLQDLYMFGFSGNEIKDIDDVELAPVIIKNADNWSSDDEEAAMEENIESSNLIENMEITVDGDEEPQPEPSHIEAVRSTNMVSNFVLHIFSYHPLCERIGHFSWG